MFLRIVAVITVLSAVSGLINVILASRKSVSTTLLRQGVSEKKRRQRTLGGLVFWMSSAAFLFLVMGHADPASVLFGLAIALAIVFPLVMIKGGLRLVSGEDARRPTAVAKDAATGESLGLIITQEDDDETRTYQIRTKDGQIVEKRADTVRIEFQ
jgi:hypothetical protein